MSAIVYWAPFAACLACLVLIYIVERRVSDLAEKIARAQALNTALEVKTRVIQERSRDFAEALLLWNHGARQEAVELLSKWGAVLVDAES